VGFGRLARVLLRGAAEVAGEATEIALPVLMLRERTRKEITDGLGRAAANGHRVLEALFARPILPVAEAQQLTGTGFATANQLVARMTELGILREITGDTHNRRFRYEPNVRLFTDKASREIAHEGNRSWALQESKAIGFAGGDPRGKTGAGAGDGGDA
jgi:hypothetical protein